MTAAVIENDIVTNVIYIDHENCDDWNTRSVMELVDTAPLGLTMGDYREGESWFRDVDGVKTALPIVPEVVVDERDEALELLGVET